MLEIYSPELVATQQEYLLALKNHRMLAASRIASVREDAENLLASARTRLEYWDIPPSEIERLEQTGEVKKTTLLEAPATGVVVKRNAIEGAHIQAGMDLFEIADLRTVWVHASFYDNEAPWISEGLPVAMELSYLPGKTYAGRVSYIYPYLREKARDVHVRLIFSNPDLDLKPGMYANIQLQGKVIPDALIVPSEAVIRSGARTLVFVAREKADSNRGNPARGRRRAGQQPGAGALRPVGRRRDRHLGAVHAGQRKPPAGGHPEHASGADATRRTICRQKTGTRAGNDIHSAGNHAGKGVRSTGRIRRAHASFALNRSPRKLLRHSLPSHPSQPLFADLISASSPKNHAGKNHRGLGP